MKPRFLFAVTLTLLNVAIVTLAWTQGLAASATGYVSPITSALPRGAATPGISGQLVIVVAEGFTTDVLRQMPSTSAFRLEAAVGALILDPNASILDILTGAHPDWREGSRQPENLFEVTSRTGATTLLAGPAEWARLAAPSATEVFVPDPLAADPQGQILRYALRRLDYWLPEFVVIVLPRATVEAEGDSQLALALGSSLESIWTMAQNRMPRDTTILVVGDTNGAPIVLAGRGVTSAPWASFTPGDLALTAAALIGAPLPAGAEGSVAYQFLTLSDPVRVEVLLAAATQRQALADAYLIGIGSEPTGEDVESDLVVARAALNGRSYNGVARLAGHALAVADAAMANGRAARLAEERVARTPAIAFAAVPLVIYLVSLLAALLSLSAIATAIGLVPRIIVHAWPSTTLSGTAAAVAAGLAYYWYAESEPRWPLLLWTLAGGAATAFILCIFIHWLQRRRSGLPHSPGIRLPGPPVEVAVASFALASTYLAALPLAWLFYRHGALVAWFLPNPVDTEILRLHLWQTFASAVILMAAPWLAALVHGLGRLLLAALALVRR